MLQLGHTNALVLMALTLQIIGLCFAVWIDPYIKREHRRLLLVITALVFTLIVQSYLDFRLNVLPERSVWRVPVSVYGYVMRPVVILLFCCLFGRDKRLLLAGTVTGVNAAIYLTAFFSDVCFAITPENKFHRGPLGYTCHIVSLMLMIYLLYLSIRGFKPQRRSETWIPVLNMVMIVAAVLADSVYFDPLLPLSYLVMVMVSACLFYYIWLHLQFVREHESALMAEQRIRIMMSQIQPHFLFNTLTTIQALCRIDPQRAAVVVEKFAVYLRANIDSLDRPELIPFEKELEHTRVYTDIEQVRFPLIRVEYDIKDGDFKLPALTVQPLVENAIRHGVRIREDGFVGVTAERVPGGHRITIRDNGVGFDPAAVVPDERTHIGMRNVGERIRTMCGGTMTVDSHPNEGTTVTLFIPQKGNETEKSTERK